MNTKVAISKMKLNGKLAHGDPRWREFNSSFVNAETDAERLLETIHNGRAITTWHANGWRERENYLLGQHVALDFDTEDENSSMKHLADDKFIRKYAAFIHTTISHTPERPRSRVVFLLDIPIHQAANYALAAQALLWMFGTADRMCKDPSRFFYGAPGCEFVWLNNVLPLEVLKKSIEYYRATGERERRRAPNRSYDAPTSQKEVESALAKIDPWAIDYGEWVSILMAIHHEFGDTGLPLAEHWGQGYAGEAERKWRSFNQSGNATGTVTIGTLFKYAGDFGWTRAEGVV